MKGTFRDVFLHSAFRTPRLKGQGDHGRCRANYRCCLPALAGFVSPQSMGPGKRNVPQHEQPFKKNSNSGTVGESGSPGGNSFPM